MNNKIIKNYFFEVFYQIKQFFLTLFYQKSCFYECFLGIL